MKITYHTQSAQQEKCLLKEMEEKQLSVEELLDEMINNRYGISKEGLSAPEIEKKVFEELETYVKNPKNFGKEFCLHDAAESFKNLEMYSKSRPTAIRAVVGRKINRLAGKPGPFENMVQVFIDTEKTKPKLSVGYRTAVYTIIAKEK